MRISVDHCPARVAQRLTMEADVPALLTERAYAHVREAAQEGRRWAAVDLWGPVERAERKRVAEQLRRDGFKVRRRRWPLRWIVDGLVLSW